ncbi:hypothetical protein B0H11DRAFT_1901293 [Mycena galericulata]|nr:hypothetical protein B0H11DRAFT_1901293 [Mycena galericulata]
MAERPSVVPGLAPRKRPLNFHPTRIPNPDGQPNNNRPIDARVTFNHVHVTRGRHVLLLPPPPGDTTERRRARRWRVAVARAVCERQRGGCARFQGRGARVGSRVVRGVATAVANRDGKQATRAMAAGSAPRGIMARRARAAGGARDKPGLSSGVELARCASDLRIASRPYASARTSCFCASGRRGGGRSRGVGGARARPLF